MMARAGRKRRRNIKRQPNGQPQREGIDAVLSVVRNQPHRRQFGDNQYRDQKAESVLGRLAMRNKISEEQYEGGRRFLVLTTRFRWAIGAPKGSPSSAAGVVIPLHGLMPEEMSADDVEITRNRYDRAFAALADSGKMAHLATYDVVIEDKPIDFARGTIHDLVNGLSALVGHFELDGTKK